MSAVRVHVCVSMCVQMCFEDEMCGKTAIIRLMRHEKAKS